MLGLDVEVPEGGELGAKGVAMASAVALGLHPSLEAASSAMVRIARRFGPTRARAAIYDREYTRFEAVAPRPRRPPWRPDASPRP